MGVFQRYVLTSFSMEKKKYAKEAFQLKEVNGTENMVQIRDLVEDLCQKLDLYKLTPAAHDLDKLNFEEFIKSRGGEKSAMASATVWTRAMLGELLQRACQNEVLMRRCRT